MSALDPDCPATAHVTDQTLLSTKKVELYHEVSTELHRESS